MSRPYRGTKVHHNRDGSVTIVKRLGPKRRNRGPGGCFPGDALVATPFGSRRIDSLEVGDLVLSYASKGGGLVPRPITAVSSYVNRELLEIRLSGIHTSLRTTRSHSILTSRGWLRAEQLRVGDKVNFATTQSVEDGYVISLASSNKCSKVFNLYTAYDHTFIVNDVVVHNFSYFRRIRVLLHRLFIDSSMHAIEHSVV